MIRKAQGRKSKGPQLYKLFIRGDWHAPFVGSKSPPSFYRQAHVVASSEATAFQYAKEFFQISVRETLRVEKRSLEDASDFERDGVYYLSGYIFYEEEKDA